MTSANILIISHGYRVKSTDDRFLLLADALAHRFSNSLAPGTFLVDTIPIRMYLHH